MNDIEYGCQVRITTFRVSMHKGDCITEIIRPNAKRIPLDPPWMCPRDGLYEVDAVAGTIKPATARGPWRHLD